MCTIPVFVYGTLKKGEPNHHWFAKSTEGISNFIGAAKTIRKYPLIIATKYNIPFLLHKPGEGHHVVGELYEVCESTLANLDELEDHPNFYIREIDQVYLNNDKSNVTDAWIYFLKTFKSELLKNEMFENYSSAGSHGLKYMERYQRILNYDYKSEVFDKQQ